VPESDGLDSMGVYLALRELVVSEGLAALTCGCYPHLMGRVCLAASLLADEGVPMACEGDVNGAVGQLMLQLLTGQPTHSTDWLNPLDDGTVIFTHCGSGSFSLAEHPSHITLSDVRLMGQGVCALFPAKPGPVTLVSLVATPGGYQVALLEGQALPTEMVFPGNPVRVRFAQPTAELIDWIHAEGIGHHWMIGQGHVGGQLRQWAKLCPDVTLLEP
jgi:L-fucose isomerase-like protein